MPRLSVKFLVKSFLLVLAVMFLLPIIMNHIDSQEADKQAQNRRSVVKKVRLH